MDQPYVKETVLRSRDVDFMGRWRPSCIFYAMQELGADHSDALGVGFEILRAQDVAWVLSRMQLEMRRYPRIGQKVIMETWPGERLHLMYTRYYTLKSEDGELLGAAASLWALLNLSDRTIVYPKKGGIIVPSFEIIPPVGLPGRAMIPSAPARTRIYEPGYRDLDVNGHVNNTCYVDWICDELGVDALGKTPVRSILVNYNHELRANQPVELTSVRVDERFGMTGSIEGTVHFTLSGALSAE